MGSRRVVQLVSFELSFCMVVVSLFVPPPSRADEPLHASLEYLIAPEPYKNSVWLTKEYERTEVAVDRDPSSPYYGTIYAVGKGIRDLYRTLVERRSTDGGRTFSDPIVVDLCTPTNASCDNSYWGIDVAVGNHGVVFVAAGGLVLRSTDQGSSWERVAFFSDFGTSSIATDATTNAVYVATASANSSATVFVTSSQDEGSTWSSPVAVSTGYPRGDDGPYGDAQIAALADSVAVAFLYGDSLAAAVRVVASQDGGLTWPTVTEVSPRTLCPLASPSLSVSPEGYFAVSWQAPVNRSGCYWGTQDFAVLATFVAISQDNGRHFSAPIKISEYAVEAEEAHGDALVFDDRSRLCTAWKAPAQNATAQWGQPSAYVACSSSLAGNFTIASFGLQAISANTYSFEETLATGTNGAVYLAWWDGRPLNEGAGTYFRSLAGEARGEVATGTGDSANFLVEVEFVDSVANEVRARVAWNGSVVVVGELPPDNYDVWIRAGDASALAGAIPVRTWNRTDFAVHVEGGPFGARPPPFPWMPVAAVGGLVLVASAVLLALQHTRLTRENVLQRKVRLLIYESIRERPGISFTEIRDSIGLQNGVTAYHLGVLERQGLIHSEKGRHHRWYYPNGDVSLWRDLPLSPMQRAVLQKVRDTPGIGIRELARSLDRRHGSVAYNVKGLAREGLLRTLRAGRKVQCFPTGDEAT